jgi:hypothetical protein
MVDQQDVEYFAKRGEMERALSLQASSPESAAIHAELADHYERLAKEHASPRQILRIVTPRA